jgi:prepilin-type N-terminal cleavage/methylation domain-containing protein
MGRCGARSSAAPEAGYTLLEVIVALVLTSLVVLMAVAAARVSYDARARLGSDLARLQGDRAARQILADALRNAEPSQRPTDPEFQLRANRLQFVAAGGAPPLDPDYDWLISVGPDQGRVAFVATPLGHAPLAPMSFAFPHVTRWDVRVLVPGDPAGLTEWPGGSVLPKAVEMRFWNDTVPVGLPLRVTLVP